jgi:hypothetical protein
LCFLGGDIFLLFLADELGMSEDTGRLGGGVGGVKQDIKLPGDPQILFLFSGGGVVKPLVLHSREGGGGGGKGGGRGKGVKKNYKTFYP